MKITEEKNYKLYPKILPKKPVIFSFPNWSAKYKVVTYLGILINFFSSGRRRHQGRWWRPWQRWQPWYDWCYWSPWTSWCSGWEGKSGHSFGFNLQNISDPGSWSLLHCYYSLITSSQYLIYVYIHKMGSDFFKKWTSAWSSMIVENKISLYVCQEFSSALFLITFDVWFLPYILVSWHKLTLLSWVVRTTVQLVCWPPVPLFNFWF